MKDYLTRKRQLLQELRTFTGLDMEIAEDGQQDEEHVLSVLDAFCEPYRTQMDAGSFWLAFLQGALSEEDEEKGLSHHQRTEVGAAVIYLLYFPQGYDETVTEILSGFAGVSDHILEQDEAHVILLRLLRAPLGQDRLQETASEIADTLSADAMIPVYVSYDSCVDDLVKLPQSFQRVTLTESCGLLFSSSERVHAYGRLGLGKLVSKLSHDDCREYLIEHLGEFRFSSLDAELSTTIRMFFEAGLSIAQTARRLYIHRNTLVYRLDKFARQSGLDLRNFDDAVTARLAMLMEAYLEG